MAYLDSHTLHGICIILYLYKQMRSSKEKWVEDKKMQLFCINLGTVTFGYFIGYSCFRMYLQLK
jgi:hypothetical protein